MPMPLTQPFFESMRCLVHARAKLVPKWGERLEFFRRPHIAVKGVLATRGAGRRPLQRPDS